MCAAILAAGLFSAISANAVGLGTMHLQSALGQPLLAQVELVSTNDSDLDSRCYKAKATSFDGSPLGNVIINLKIDGPTPAIILTTAQSINEPALNLGVEYTCGSQTRREYQILLDLMPVTPATVAVQHSVEAPAALAKHAVELSSQPAVGAAVADAQPITKKSKHRHRQSTEIKSNNEYATAQPASASESTEVRHKKLPTKAFRNVLRLGNDDGVDNSLNDTGGMQLALSHNLGGATAIPDTQPVMQTQTDASALASPAPISALTSAAAASAAGNAFPSDAGLQELQAKIRVLEAETEELRKLNAKHLAALDIAQTSKTGNSPLLYLYFMLFASFVAIAWLVWRTRQIQSEISHSSWHQIVPEQSPIDERDREREEREQVEDDAFLEAHEDRPEAKNVTSLKQVPRLVPVEAAEVRIPASPPQLSVTPGPVEEHVEGDYKFPSNVRSALPDAEEILDEIQQAEFWMDMQQPQRAIEILESNWGGERPSSPLPWLYLFDLYRIVGDQEKYTELAERFEHIFNGRVIPWGDGNALEHSRTLEEFPILMSKIIDCWPTEELVPFLENLLIDDRDGRRQGFDLAAYRDILFLANIAYEIQDSSGSSKAPQNSPEWSLNR
ncbi:MAG TPA: hypothetical protein VK832_01985 [Burkholderiaceae bacterium]|nr:hypothetical protein [Burkholderiaceae bacterium]